MLKNFEITLIRPPYESGSRTHKAIDRVKLLSKPIILIRRPLNAPNISYSTIPISDEGMVPLLFSSMHIGGEESLSQNKQLRRCSGLAYSVPVCLIANGV